MLPLILVVAAGTVLRLFHLGHSLRVDELEIWAHSRLPLRDMVADLNRLPHVSLLARLAEVLLGGGEFSLRLPFALYGVMTLPLLFLTGRELFDDEVGLLAALLLAVSDFHIRYCQELRYYAPFTFYSLGAFYCLLRLLRREAAADSNQWRVCLAVFLLSHLLNLYLHRMAVYPLTLSAVLIVWDVSSRRARRNSLELSRWGIPALAILLILALLVISQWRWLRLILFRESLGALSLRMSYLTWHYRDPRASVAWELLSAYSGGWRAASIFLAAGATGLLVSGREGWRRTAPLLLWIAAPLVSLAVVRTRTHFELRYFIFLLPAWLIWAASGLSATASFLGKRFARRWALLGMVAAVAACETPSLAGYYRLPKARIREAFDFVNASCSDGDVVVMYPAWNALWYGYYRLKGGCRLLHPANLDETSPAFAPESVLGAPRRVWLAGTWIADPVRAEEFERIRGFLSRRCEPVAERLFQSRDPNDDYRVSSFHCRGSETLARRASAVHRGIRPSFWRWDEGYWLLGNIPQLGGMMRERWRFAKDLSLVSARTGLADAGLRDKILFIWSGSGTISGSGGSQDFSAGDVFFLPKRAALRWRSGSSSNAAVLELALPGQADGPAVAPGRLGNALDSGRAQAETVLLQGRGWRLVVYRMAPGGEQTVASDSHPPMSRMLSALLRGQLRIRRNEACEYAFPGDLFTAQKSPIDDSWQLKNLGPGDSTELRLIMEDASSLLRISPMTSSTGKGVGAWPPMLIP